MIFLDSYASSRSVCSSLHAKKAARSAQREMVYEYFDTTSGEPRPMQMDLSCLPPQCFAQRCVSLCPNDFSGGNQTNFLNHTHRVLSIVRMSFAVRLGLA